MNSISLNHFNQKEEEKLIMELFRNEYDDFPKGKLIKSESPDFILKNSIKYTTGIELTKLHGPEQKKNKTHFTKGDSSFNSPEPSLQNIQHTIQAKEEKLYLYNRKMSNELWLIITTDLSGSPISYNLNNKLSNWSFSSQFDKVFLFELMKRKIFELV